MTSGINWRGRDLARPVGMVFLEAFLIALGVLLALGANEWRQETRDRQVAASALQSIQDELAYNKAAVDSSFAYHGRITARLRQIAAENGDPPQDSRMFNKGYIYPAEILSAAWDTATESDALRTVPFETRLEIARMYAEQDRYRRQSEIAGELIYRTLFTEGTRGILDNYQNHIVILMTFAYRERELGESYQACLGRLGQQE